METSGEVDWGSLRARPEAIFDSRDVENYLNEVTGEFMAGLGSARRGIDWAATFFRHGKARTIAASSPKARDADREQCSFADGPVLEALASGHFVLVSDLRQDRRWPGYSSAAASHGVQSLLSMPIVSSGESSAAINLYASSAHEFTSEDVVRTIRYAREVSRSLRVVVRIAARAEAAAELAIAQRSLALVDLNPPDTYAQEKYPPDTYAQDAYAQPEGRTAEAPRVHAGKRKTSRKERTA